MITVKRFLAIEDIEIFDIGMIYCKPVLVHDDLILSYWL